VRLLDDTRPGVVRRIGCLVLSCDAAQGNVISVPACSHSRDIHGVVARRCLRRRTGLGTTLTAYMAGVDKKMV